jgi:histone H1/5
MRVLVAAAIVLSLAGTAYAQVPAFNLAAPEKKKDPAKEAKDEEIDRAYRDATQGKATGPASNDPWGAVRAYEHPAPKPKAAAAKPKVQAQSQPQAQSQSPWPAAPTPR